MKARQDVESLLEELREILEVAGVPETQINVAKGPNYKVHHFAKAFDWLHAFSLSPQVEHFREIYSLRPPEVWKHYRIIGVEGLQEQQLLKQAASDLLIRWRHKRPRMFGKDKKCPEQSA